MIVLIIVYKVRRRRLLRVSALRALVCHVHNELGAMHSRPSEHAKMMAVVTKLSDLSERLPISIVTALCKFRAANV